MQYDLKKVLENKAVISLEWHGEDTFVKLSEKDAGKTEVKTGDVVKVSVKIAEFLLSYSDQWTLKGDKPVEQPWRKARADAMEAREAKLAARKSGAVDEDEAGDDEPVELNEETIGAMKKDELRAELAKIAEAEGVKDFKLKNSLNVATLKEMLLEKVNGIVEDAETVTEDDEDEDAPGDDRDVPEGDDDSKDEGEDGDDADGETESEENDEEDASDEDKSESDSE